MHCLCEVHFFKVFLKGQKKQHRPLLDLRCGGKQNRTHQHSCIPLKSGREFISFLSFFFFFLANVTEPEGNCVFDEDKLQLWINTHLVLEAQRDQLHKACLFNGICCQ